jgi:hypothetical protein
VSTTTVTQLTLPCAQTQARPGHVPAERGDSGAWLRLAAVVSPASEETQAVRSVYEREAANYDQNVKLPERRLFSGGRE